jgi:hypothetical protein
MTGVQIVAAGPAPLAAKSLIAKRIEKHVRYGSMLLKKSAARAECATIESKRPAVRIKVARTTGFLNQNCPAARSKSFFNSIGQKRKCS